jgi:hypothetical protein
VNRFSRSAALLIIIAVAGLAGCSSSSSSPSASPPPPAYLTVGSHGAVSVVLTPLGAQRTGVQTAVATRAARGGQTVVPYSALLYQPDGSSVIYALTYTLVPVTVTSVQGNQVYLTGLAPGTTVVTIGGEELLGVQDGVAVQT